MFHPCEMQMLHYRTVEDADWRVEFYEIITAKMSDDPRYLKSFCFSDESTF